MFAMWFSSTNDVFLFTHLNKKNVKEKSWMIVSLSLLAQMSEQYAFIVDGITQQSFLFHNLSPSHMVMHSHTIMHGNDLC